MTELDKLVLDCQEESIALTETLRAKIEADGCDLRDLAVHVELFDVDLERVFFRGAPDEIDLEAFVRVAYLLGYKVVLEERV